jgi:hypothetical protein
MYGILLPWHQSIYTPGAVQLAPTTSTTPSVTIENLLIFTSRLTLTAAVTIWGSLLDKLTAREHLNGNVPKETCLRETTRTFGLRGILVQGWGWWEVGPGEGGSAERRIPGTYRRILWPPNLRGSDHLIQGQCPLVMSEQSRPRDGSLNVLIWRDGPLQYRGGQNSIPTSI